MADNETAGVLAKILGEVEKVSHVTHENAAELTELKVKAATLQLQLDKSQSDNALVQEKANADLAIVKAALAETHGGPSGAEDWLNETSKFVRGVYSQKMLQTPSAEVFKTGEKVSDYVGKAVLTAMSTNVAATAGSLIPVALRPGFTELKQVHGNLYPMVTKFNSPPGQSVTVNHRTGRPVATWRGATQGSAMAQTDPNTHTYGTDTLSPQLLYDYEIISNEMMVNPAVNFAATAVLSGAASVNKALEIAMLSAASVPHGGITTVATAKTTMASATFALVVAFIKEAVAANDWMGDTTENKILLTPRDALTLATQPVGASELTGMLVWGDPRKGIPTTLLGYEVVIHPACKLSTTYSIVIGNPADVILAESPSYMIDFDSSIKFAEFATAMRVGNHYDFVVKQATQWYKATVTA